MRTILTKSEIRQTLTADPVVAWWIQTIKDRFDHQKNLIGAPNAERLWQLKGHAEVIRFISDIDGLLEMIDLEEE